MRMPKPPTYDHIKSKKKPVVRSTWIALDPEIAEQKEDLEQQVALLRARAKVKPDDADLQAQLAEEEMALDKKVKDLRKECVKFVFRSLGRRAYDDLVTEHQATDEQTAKAKAEAGPDAVLEFNPDTFPAALVAACLQEPELTASEVSEIFESDDWNGSELMSLFNTALEACITRTRVNLGNV